MSLSPERPTEIVLQSPPMLPKSSSGGMMQLMMFLPMMLGMGAMSFVYIGRDGGVMTWIFGALFIQFVPNVADELSKSAPWAIYGVLLIGMMYLMPTGAMGLLKAAWARLRPVAAPGLKPKTPALTTPRRNPT